VPNWKPGQPSANGEARRFINWYLDALVNFQNWQIDLTAELYPNSQLAVMYPGWGIRSSQGWLEQSIAGNLGTDTMRSGETPIGNDFARQIAAINNPRVVVYCTWIDAPSMWAHNEHETTPGPTNNFTPVQYLAYYTHKHPLDLKLMGENTGGHPLESMSLTFERMRRFDMDGLMWAFERELYGGREGWATIYDFEKYIRDFLEYKAGGK
jgi:hypothetical protein